MRNPVTMLLAAVPAAGALAATRGETPGRDMAAAITDVKPEARGTAGLVAEERGKGFRREWVREGILAPAAPGRGVAAVTADGEHGARGTAGDAGPRADLTNQIEQIKQLVTEHDGGLARSNLDRAKEVVGLGLLLIACLAANPRLRKKDLAAQIGKHAAWVTRFTRAARLAQDPGHISADQARAILLKAHGNTQRAAKQGRVFTSQSLAARIVRAVRDALRLGVSALEIRVSVEAVLSGAESPKLRPYATPDKEWRP